MSEFIEKHEHVNTNDEDARLWENEKKTGPCMETSSAKNVEDLIQQDCTFPDVEREFFRDGCFS